MQLPALSPPLPPSSSRLFQNRVALTPAFFHIQETARSFYKFPYASKRGLSLLHFHDQASIQCSPRDSHHNFFNSLWRYSPLDLCCSRPFCSSLLTATLVIRPLFTDRLSFHRSLMLITRVLTGQRVQRLAALTDFLDFIGLGHEPIRLRAPEPC